MHIGPHQKYRLSLYQKLLLRLVPEGTGGIRRTMRSGSVSGVDVRGKIE
jgi:hypothetical protein